MLKTRQLLILFSFTLLSVTGKAQYRAIEDQPFRPLQKGKELFQKGQYGNALNLLDQVWPQEENYTQTERSQAAYLACQAAIKLYQGDIKERIREFQENFPLSPLVNEIYLDYAHNLFSLKRYRQASEYYREVDPFVLSKKDRAEYAFKFAYALLQDERLEEAQKRFRDIKDDNSAYANSAKYYYAHLLYEQEEYQRALQDFLDLRETPAFSKLIPYYLAHIYYQIGDYEELINVGEELLAEASESRASEIAKLIADAYYQKDQHREVIKYLDIYDRKGGRMGTQENFQKGFAHYQLQQYRPAVEAFNKITGGPDSLRQLTYYHLGDSYIKLGEKRQAMIAFKAAIDYQFDPKIREDAFYNYAKLAYELSDPFQDAIATLNQFQNSFPDSPHRQKVNSYLANLYITTKDYDKALEALERNGLNNPRNRILYQRISFYQANEHYVARRYEKALAQYRETQRYSGNSVISALSVYWEGQCLYELNRYEKALRSLKAFRSKTGAPVLPEFAASFYHSGYAHFKLYQFEAAINEFRIYLDDEDADASFETDALLRLGDAYLMTAQYPAASEFYRRALNAGTAEGAYAYFQKALAEGLSGKIEAKLQSLQNLRRDYPQSAYAEKALYEQALTLLQDDQYDRALSVFKDFIRSYPQSALRSEAVLKKGLTYANLNNQTAAIDEYKRVVNEYPGTQEALEAIKLAEIAYKRANRINDYLDWVDGLAFVDIERSALDSTAYSAAFDLYSTQNYRQALGAFDRYLSRFPEGVFQIVARYYAARSAERLERTDTAAQFYRDLVELPQNRYTADALNYLARYHESREEMSQARDYYQRLVALSSPGQEITELRRGLMETNFALGDYEASLEQAEMLQQDSLGSATELRASQIKAKAFFAQKKWEEAETAFSSLIEKAAGEPLAEAYYQLALIQHKQNRFDTSNQTINRLIEELPAFKEWKQKALLLMARNFWRLEDIFQANYILDYLESSAATEELKAQAQELRAEIAQAEKKALLKKQKLMEQQAVPVKLDPEAGFEIIDAGETEITEETEEIEKPDDQ